MKTQTMRRVLGAATAVGASVALIGTGLAGAAPSSDLSSDSGGSAASSGSSASKASADVNDPLTFSMWETCDTEASAAMGGPDGTIPFGGCVEAVVRSGTMNIGSFSVPIPDGSLRISGGIKPVLNDSGFPSGTNTFVPSTGAPYGVFYRDLPVPGGALGTGSAENFGLTSASASVEAVGLPEINLLSLKIDMPVRVKLSNPLLGDNCYLGSADDPINLHLAPKSPDDMGEFTSVGSRYPGVPGTLIAGAINVDNDFAVPSATGCGLLGSLNWFVNARAHTPSASGNNSLTVTFDAYNASITAVEKWRESTD